MNRVAVTHPSIADISALFDPIGLERFRSDVLERTAFRSPEGATPAAGLWDLERHGDALWAHRDRIGEYLYMTRRAVGINLPRSQQSQLLRFAVEQFATGATLIARRLGHLDPTLARLQRAAEAALHCRVSINAYLTPPDSEGFLEHFDTHDTLILQVHGSKRWRIHEGGPHLPLRRQAVELGPHDLGPVAEEFDLHCGGVLYMPRGVVHAARATDEISLHLTLGLHPVLWSDVASEAIGLAAECDTRLRARADGEIPEVLRERFSPDLLNRAIDRCRMADIDERSKVSLFDFAPTTTVDSRWRTVRRDPMLPAAVVREGERVLVHFPGGVEVGLTAPATCETALRYIASNDHPFGAGDLPGLSDSSARVLIDRLITAGLLVVETAEE